MELSMAIKYTLGTSYDYDRELQYLGNPIAYWITDYEEQKVQEAKELAATSD